MKKNFKFYMITDNYIEYLSRYEKHIAYNKNLSRPYVGIVLNINGNNYFAPMFSPKPQHEKYKENFSFFKMYDNEHKKNYLGLIRFSDMIPVSFADIIPIDIKNKTNKYITLLNNQYNYINKPENKKIILNKAKKLYDNVMVKKNTKTARFYKSISCNFYLLEEKCLEYNKVQDSFLNLHYIEDLEDLFYIYDNINNKDNYDKCLKILDTPELYDKIQTLDISKFEEEEEDEI